MVDRDSPAISKDLLARLFKRVLSDEVTIASGAEVYIPIFQSPEQRNFHFLLPSVVVKNTLVAASNWSHAAGVGDTALGAIVHCSIFSIYNAIDDVVGYFLQIANHGLGTVTVNYELYQVKGL